MADITKCKGDGCPIKDSCKRFTAEIGERQSWFVEIPGSWEKTDMDEKPTWICQMYWGPMQDQIMETLTKIVSP